LLLERLDWLKLNNGATALDILAGANATLWRTRPSIFAAIPDDLALSAIAGRLREFGYRCWRMETPWFNPQNFNRRVDDIHGGRVALALLAIPEEGDVSVAQSGCVELS